MGPGVQGVGGGGLAPRRRLPGALLELLLHLVRLLQLSVRLGGTTRKGRAGKRTRGKGGKGGGKENEALVLVGMCDLGGGGAGLVLVLVGVCDL